MKWQAARKYCQDNRGDLIQKDTRLYTRSGRMLVVKDLKLI